MCTFQMWLVRKPRKTHLLLSILLLAIILLTVSFLQLVDLLYAQRHRPYVEALPLKETTPESETPASYHKAKKGSQTNYSSKEADDLAVMLKVHLELNYIQFNLYDETEDYFQFLRRLDQNPKKGKCLKSFLHQVNSTNSWARFYRGINQYYLYQPEDDNILTDLLTDMRNRPVASIEELTNESQLRFVFTLQDGGTALFTPKRFAEEERHPDHYFKTDFVSHKSEIAAFHLDRVLSMYKVPPTVGRIVNITSDVMIHASKSLRTRFYESEEGNMCIRGPCDPHCVTTCGSPHLVEGSMSVVLPDEQSNPVQRKKHPIKTLYLKIKKRKMEENFKYCRDNILNRRLQKAVPIELLEVIELSIFDFLIDNMNRQFIERFKEFGTDAFILHNNNGRGFSKAKRDCSSCLTPLQQCCMIRMSTLLKLLKLYLGPNSLSQVMRDSLKDEPLSRVLLESHLNALDRRLWKILKVVRNCLTGVKYLQNVVINDVIR